MGNKNNLRRNEPGRQQKWTVEEIKYGLEYYYELHGRYPSAREIDLFEYLPSSRSIQRSLGGLKNLRELLNLGPENFDYTSGLSRSNKATEIYQNAVVYEEEFYKYLISIFPEVKIHEHKILRPGHVCCDFFIYLTEAGGVAVDLFYAQDIYTLGAQITIKEKRYRGVNCKTYFVLVNNENISQEEIDIIVDKKKNKLPNHIKVITERVFKSNITSLII